MPLPTGRALLDAEQILSYAGLGLGDRYADFGAGTLGHFVLPGSEMVGPNGKVYAVDILKNALSAIEGRVRHEGVTNVETIWADIERVGSVSIPEHSLDLVSFVNLTGLVTKSPQVFEEAARLLKEDGKFLLVDWEPGGASFGPAEDRRVSPSAIVPALAKAGFALGTRFKAGPYHWGAMARRA